MNRLSAKKPFTAPPRLPPKLPPRIKLADSVYETLKETVMSGGLKAEARLNIDQLARELSVSPTPVREALARLEWDGLVVSEPLTGYSVAPPLAESRIEELFEMRVWLEPIAARLAAENVQPEPLVALAEAQETMRRAITAGERNQHERGRNQPTTMFWTGDVRFHTTIQEMSERRLLAEAIERLRPYLQLARLVHLHTGIAIETVEEHDAILTAIKSEAPGEAASAMRRHIEASRRRLRSNLKPV
jgi:DNA-binding GntR family transcriptional regulator